MPRKSPFTIALSTEEKEILKATSTRYTSLYRDVIRAKIVLLASEGWDNKRIGERLDVPRQIVSKWRKRFYEEGMAGLAERSRRGRPRLFSP